MWQTCSGRSRAKTYRASASSLVGLAQGATTTGEWPNKAYSIPSLTSKGGQCLRDPYPALVANLTRRGRPGPRLRQLKPLRGDRTEPNQPQIEAEKDPPPARVESLPPPARVGNHPPQFQVGSLPPPARAVNWPPQAEVRNQPPREALSTRPRKGKERAMVPGPKDHARSGGWNL